MNATGEHAAIPEIMTTPEVAKALNVEPGTIRSWILRESLGKSCPTFPAPMGKVYSGWIWNQQTVIQFLANKQAG